MPRDGGNYTCRYCGMHMPCGMAHKHECPKAVKPKKREEPEEEEGK